MPTNKKTLGTSVINSPFSLLSLLLKAETTIQYRNAITLGLISLSLVQRLTLLPNLLFHSIIINCQISTKLLFLSMSGGRFYATRFTKLWPQKII